MHEHLAFAVRRSCNSDGARPRRGGLADAPLPDPAAHLAGAVDADDLHVRSGWEPRMRLEERPDAHDLIRVAAHDGVRVADRDRDELDPLDGLPRANLDLAHVRLELAVVEHAGGHVAP